MSTPWRPSPPSYPAATLSQIPIARPRSTSPHPSEKQQIGKSPAGMEGLDVDDVYQHYRLDPTEVEAVTYYLPRLISGETLHGAEKLIHRVDIYGCEPKDLAARFAPVPQAISSGDRFFFTTCKSKNGSKTQSVRSAGGGTWTIQKTSEIGHAEGKVSEVKNLSFKKKGKSTGWVMEEYRCLLPEATVTDGVKVLCRIHLAQHPPDAARQESAAYKRQEAQPEPVAASTRAQKRPAPQPEHVQKRPAPAATADPPKKRMRVAVPVLAPATPSFTAAASVSLPSESIAEADDDMGRFSCSMEELLGVQVEETLTVGATNNIGQSFYFEPEEPRKLFVDAAEEIVGTYHAAADLHAPFEAEWHAQEVLDKEAAPLEAEENMEQSYYSEPDELQLLLAMIDEATAEQQRQAVSTNDESSVADEALGKDERYNAASLQGHDHLFESRPCFFDPFEAAWKAEEAVENEKRYNDSTNLHAGPLGGHNNFFSSASVH